LAYATATETADQSRRYDGGHERDRRLRVFVPWKAMIVGSVILTIVVNLVLRVI